MYDEAFSFFSLYLFSGSSQYYSFISYYVTKWNQRKDWKAEFIIRSAFQFEPDQGDVTLKESLEFIERNRKLKAIKHKNKLTLSCIIKYNNYIESGKNFVLDQFELVFAQSGFQQWIELFDKEIAEAFYFQGSNDFKENQEDNLIKLLQEAIYDCDDFLSLNDYVNHFFKAINIEESDIALSAILDDCYFEIPLFSFPFIFNLDKEKMIALRGNMQPKMKNMHAMFHEFKTAMNKEEFNEILIEKCKSFYQQLLPEISIVQNQIDNNIYFQQEKHMGPEHTLITLNLGVAPISMIIDYYEKSGTLKPFVAAALKRQLSLKTDISKCDVFLYWTTSIGKLSG